MKTNTCLGPHQQNGAKCFINGATWHQQTNGAMWHPACGVPYGTIGGVVFWTKVWHPKQCHLAPFLLTVNGQIEKMTTLFKNAVAPMKLHSSRYFIVMLTYAYHTL